MPRPGGRPSRQYLEDTKRMQEKRKLREVGMNKGGLSPSKRFASKLKAIEETFDSQGKTPMKVQRMVDRIMARKKADYEKKKYLTGGQAKIAAKAPPTNKIDEKDFAVLRAEKAKDRGKGLQDEKVKPGKVMKAKRGQFSKSSAGTTAKSAMGKTFAGYSKVFKTGVSAGDKAKATSTIIGVKPKLPKPSKTSSLARRALKSVQATSLGKKLLPVVAAGVAAQQYLKSKMKKKKEEPNKKMGGGMMKVPGYVSGTDKMGVKPKIKYSSSVGKTVTIKDGRIALTDPDTPKAGRPKAPPPPRKRRLPQQARRSVGKRAGLGALGGTGRKEDSSVTLGKFMKAKTDALNESVKAGGMKKERITQGSNMRRPAAFVKDVEAGKYNKPNKDAAYYKSIGLTGERGDRAVKDFFKPSDIRLKNIMAGNYMGGGMMNKPMGYKSGKSIKVKCKLGKNKPTKMY